MSDPKSGLLYDFHSIEQALKTGRRRCRKIVVVAGKGGRRWEAVLAAARNRNIPTETLPAERFRKQYGPAARQGIAGHFSEFESISLGELIENALQSGPNPIIAILDEIQDPQNVGALIRSAYALGLKGMILPSRRSAPLNETVAKCSAGALELLPIAVTGNLVEAVKKLKKSGFWIVAADKEGGKSCDRFRFDMPVAVVIGGEEKGVRPLLRQACDFSISIPMQGGLDSLNASVAGAILFYEIQRQRKAESREKDAK